MKKLKNYLFTILLICVIFGIAYGATWLTGYKYKQCKSVGYSTLYCILDIGK